jgi:hypothetical protein
MKSFRIVFSTIRSPENKAFKLNILGENQRKRTQKMGSHSQ